MKKIIIGLFVLILAGVIVQPVHALTQAEIQAKIAALQAQIAALQAQIERLAPQAPNASSTLVVTSQTGSSIWPKATRQKVTWSYTNLPNGRTVDIFLVSGSSTTPIVKNAPLKKGEARIPLRKLNRVDLGVYNVKIVYSQQGYQPITALSSGSVIIAPAPDPLITITAPLTNTTWTNGRQRITWTANFVRKQVDGNGGRYAGIRIVPTYGIGPDARSLDLSRFSPADRDIILRMKPSDIVALSKLTEQELEDLDPLSRNIPGISSTGLDEIMKITDEGIDLLKELDVLGVGEFTQDAILKPLRELGDIDPGIRLLRDNDPVFGAVFGDLFGDDEKDVPEKVPLIIEAVPVTNGVNGTPIKIGKSYVEKGRHTVSLSRLTPGQYKIKFTAKLPKKVLDRTPEGEIIAWSGVFNVTQRQGGQQTASTTSLFKITNPSGGETWTPGSLRTIRWRSTEVPRNTAIIISLIHSTKTSYNEPIGITTFNVGEKEVRLPTALIPTSELPDGSGYQIKLFAVVNGSAVEAKSNTFKILGAQTTSTSGNTTTSGTSNTTTGSNTTTSTNTTTSGTSNTGTNTTSGSSVSVNIPSMLYAFGGMYTTRADGTLAYGNPLAGNAAACPGGYASSQVLGVQGSDQKVYYCYKNISSVEEIDYDFGGIFGPNGGTGFKNPATGANSCPSGYTAYKYKGLADVDYSSTFCYRSHVSGQNPALFFGGMFGYGASGTYYSNPLGGNAQNCPSAYLMRKFSGVSGMDREANFCYVDPAVNAGAAVHSGASLEAVLDGIDGVLNQIRAYLE
jgi:hypothetical protein